MNLIELFDSEPEDVIVKSGKSPIDQHCEVPSLDHRHTPQDRLWNWFATRASQRLRRQGLGLLQDLHLWGHIQHLERGL